MAEEPDTIPTDDQRFSSLVWEGKYWGKKGALARGWERYQTDPEKYLIEWASTLYSALGRAKVDHKPIQLLKCVLALRPLISDLMVRGVHARSAEEVDVITSILWAWAGIAKYVPLSHSEAAYWATEMLATRWIPEASGHTKALLLLTAVRWHMYGAHGNPVDAIEYLSRVTNEVEGIVDPNQAARVLRGLATLYWDVGAERLARKYAAQLYDLEGLS